MLKVEKFVTASPEQWEIIIEGMRNPKNSWDKIDSYETMVSPKLDAHDISDYERRFILGPNDRDLATRLTNGGPVHAKYRRMIPVHVTINAPLYWWKEFDTYKVGTTANSCSTMHKIHAKEFTTEDFSCEHLICPGDECLGHGDPIPSRLLDMTIRFLNFYRKKFIETGDKKYWEQMIQLLPSSYNQKRTIKLNYEVLHNIYIWRKNHKLDEWHVLCDWIQELPYSELIID